MTTKFIQKARAKGYTNQDLGERWGLQPRSVSRIAQAPKQLYEDALAGLPQRQLKLNRRALEPTARDLFIQKGLGDERDYAGLTDEEKEVWLKIAEGSDND